MLAGGLVAALALAGEDFEWGWQSGEEVFEYATAVASHAQGDVYTTGFAHYQDVSSEVFVRRQDATDGSVQWYREFGTSTLDRGRAVVVDAAGQSLVVAGVTAGNIPEGTGPFTGIGGAWTRDGFVVKVSVEDGSRLWATQYGTVTHDVFRDVAIGKEGRLVAVGDTFGDLDAPLVEPETFHRAATVVAYTREGAERWHRQFGTEDCDGGLLPITLAYGTAVDASGDSFTTGLTWCDVATGTGGPIGDVFDAFLVKHHRDGSEAWRRQFGTATITRAADVGVDGAGHAYLAGATVGDLATGEGWPAGFGSWDVWVRKYDADGHVLWTEQFGTEAADGANGIGVGPDGDVWVVGVTFGNLHTGEGFGHSLGGRDAFVAHFDAHGEMLSLRQFGTDSFDEAYDAAADGAGGGYVSAESRASLFGEFGGRTDAIVARVERETSLRGLGKTRRRLSRTERCVAECVREDPTTLDPVPEGPADHVQACVDTCS